MIEEGGLEDQGHAQGATASVTGAHRATALEAPASMAKGLLSSDVLQIKLSLKITDKLMNANYQNNRCGLR